jgi:hypothetical protein
MFGGAAEFMKASMSLVVNHNMVGGLVGVVRTSIQSRAESRIGCGPRDHWAFVVEWVIFFIAGKTVVGIAKSTAAYR